MMTRKGFLAVLTKSIAGVCVLAKTGVHVKGKAAVHRNTWAWLLPVRGRDERLCGSGGQLVACTLYFRESSPAYARQYETTRTNHAYTQEGGIIRALTRSFHR